MKPEDNYIAINRESWNNRTDAHLKSAFYDMEGFLKGNTSLKSIELEMLGDISGKKILHLQCHFGQDTLSMGRMGAEVTGVDLSDQAILAANNLSDKIGVPARFISCDIFDLPQHLNEDFDIVFTSYGTIGWLPDINRWAAIVSKFLKPNGRFIFVEFHPVVWMFDDDFKSIAFNYSKAEAIVESEEGTYADKDAKITQNYVMWNHGLGEVIAALIQNGISIESFKEYDYSPYDCFDHTIEYESGKFRIKHLENKIPMVYALAGSKK